MLGVQIGADHPCPSWCLPHGIAHHTLPRVVEPGRCPWDTPQGEPPKPIGLPEGARSDKRGPRVRRDDDRCEVSAAARDAWQAEKPAGANLGTPRIGDVSPVREERVVRQEHVRYVIDRPLRLGRILDVII